MEIPQHILSLIQRQAAGEQLSGQERAIVQEWYSSIDVQEAFDHKDWQDLFAFLKIDADTDTRSAVLKKFLAKADFADQTVSYEGLQAVGEDRVVEKDIAVPVIEGRVPMIRRWGWAAAILLMLSTGAYLYFRTNTTPKDLVKREQVQPSDILPGTNKAVLTLADGSKITLDSTSNGTIAQQGNTSITKSDNGEIRYNVQGTTLNLSMENTMFTPRGGQYMLILPDGSKVWLNAASSITYPVAFTGNTRKVSVSGELYFEVTKDKSKPFIVDIEGKSSVEVLGTSFNVNAYSDEPTIKTTLIEGIVKVNNDAVLRPGQQAIITKTTKALKVVTANIEQTVAWKNGLFDFNGLSVREVMNQLSRWYDIDVKFEGKEPGVRLMGEMYRNGDLSKVLKLLQKMNIQYRLEGKTLIIL